jgi:hypothetical protein
MRYSTERDVCEAHRHFKIRVEPTQILGAIK